nr:MAG TPA: hypothetical protein [Bacteriophage sp.]DAZ25719.1 MAG TPA: hypothetical protein [Caudoviricetes sp.]
MALAVIEWQSCFVYNENRNQDTGTETCRYLC